MKHHAAVSNDCENIKPYVEFSGHSWNSVRFQSPPVDKLWHP